MGTLSIGGNHSTGGGNVLTGAGVGIGLGPVNSSFIGLGGGGAGVGDGVCIGMGIVVSTAILMGRFTPPGILTATVAGEATCVGVDAAAVCVGAVAGGEAALVTIALSIGTTGALSIGVHIHGEYPTGLPIDALHTGAAAVAVCGLVLCVDVTPAA